MEETNGRARPTKHHLRATAQAKRKHLGDDTGHAEQVHTKKQKFVAETQTLVNLTTSNRFLPCQISRSERYINKNHCHAQSSSISPCSRRWVFSDSDLSAYQERVVVVSYNILGVENASKHPDLYFKIPPKFLDWDRRKQLIYEEINHYNAGILCFQEVDRFNDLDCVLQVDGFKGVYKARTGEACDGCAIFWKEKLFSLLHEENIEFQSYGLRDNVAQLCVLKMKENISKVVQLTQSSKAKSIKNRRIVVGNVHVLFNPNRGDIKLGQVRLFLERAYTLSQEWGGIPVILGGDLNSLPHSAIYQFLVSSKLNILVHNRRNISGQLEHPPQHKHSRFRYKNAKSNCMSISKPSLHIWSDEELTLATGSKRVTHLCHQLKLCSAYLGIPGSCRSRDNHGEPLATSYHSKFMGTVDYIWHTEELIPVRVLETLPVDILKRSAGLPNKKLGSDHLALVCELAFADYEN